MFGVGFTRVLSTDTVYTLKLRRRGIDLDHQPLGGMHQATFPRAP